MCQTQSRSRTSFAAGLLPIGEGEMSEYGWEVEVARVRAETS